MRGDKARCCGRPKVEDPKVKLENVRLRTSMLIKLEITCSALGLSKTEFVEAIIAKAIEDKKNVWECEIIF